ncbi:MAG: hypothetical protein DYG90_00660 [Chloroflexi bacterium CFX6]|nr:hypothetical protein [Chloroflexi bacterium CFX6]
MTIKLIVKPLTQTFEIVWGKTNRVFAEVYAKNDFVLQFEVVDEAGDPVDVSTYTTRNFGVYPLDSGSASFSKTPAFATDGTDGVMTVTVADTDTTALAGDYRMELQISKTGAKETLVSGTLRFIESWVS